MKIYLQDNDHASIVLVGAFKRSSELRYRVNTVGLEVGQPVILSQLKFRHSEYSDKWRFVECDQYPIAFEKRGKQALMADSDEADILSMWGSAREAGRGVIKLRDSLGEDFNCRSGLMRCGIAMGVGLIASDFKDEEGTDYDFSVHEI